MGKRPEFEEIKSYEEFEKYYWYREELSAICRQLGIDNTGTKQELNYNIREYFSGNQVKKKSSHYKGKKSVKEITPDCPLLDCGFSFNSRFRAYFSEQTKVENFKFTADMATAWRKVKQENDYSFTIQDMLDIYYHKSDYAKYDNSACQWNKFLKDFCADENNSKFPDKLKAASFYWKIVKDSSQPKVYSGELVKKYRYKE